MSIETIHEVSPAELLHVMLQAPASEIDAMIPDDHEEAAKMINLDPDYYKGTQHYYLVLANARRNWALAMVAASSTPFDFGPVTVDVIARNNALAEVVIDNG